MNRKIFTLLACALMLFSTAFTINAKVVGGNRAVGDTVRTLPLGKGMGIYHIRIDSIYTGNTDFSVTGWEAPDDRGIIEPHYADSVSRTDTLVLGVTDAGKVIPVSANDLRHYAHNGISYEDLQSTMWCIEIEKTEQLGQMPTFHFTNNVFGRDLEFDPDRKGYLASDSDKRGWMFSYSYENEVNTSVPLRRLDNGKYDVLVYNFEDSCIYQKSVSIDSFTNRTVHGMLSFTIVEVAPVVLDANAFNTRLGQVTDGSLTQLKFDPAPTSEDFPNYFGKGLKAYDDPAYGDWGYLNVRVGGGDKDPYIYNITHLGEDGDRYTNEYGGVKHIRILADGNYNPNRDNNSYRFVYFPSRDSLVINALRVSHLNNSNPSNSNSSVADGEYWDDVARTSSGGYVHDASNSIPKYYGLYTERIHDRLIVRLQDLYGTNGASLMTIGQLPANTRISLGVDNCQIEIDAWTPSKGIYTIWDDKGRRVLGVRPYNGALVAQWIELRAGECPDRIPSYQWVIEEVNGESGRVNIFNREFGDGNSEYVNMKNVLIKNGRSQIFQNQSQFSYGPIQSNGGSDWESVRHGWVTSQYLSVDEATDCTLKESASGFRPVNKAYTRDQYLGYKHFFVETNAGSINFGKSEDVAGPGNMTEKGMDYNAFAFNYLHEATETDGREVYIDLTANRGDSVLHVNPVAGQKEGFQFRLGAILRNDNYQTEKYGYPRDEVRNYYIHMNDSVYPQEKVPVLERYYYELKVADYYNFRDSLSEQYVVLKGAAGDGSDLLNKFNYGVANVYADKDPFQFANVYLRETYFLVKDKKLNEERKLQDPSRRTYYALIDRIASTQFDRLANMGYEIMDTLKGHDASSEYGLLLLGVDDYTGMIRGITKTVASTVMSTFALENMNYPLYRRLVSKEDDGAVNNGHGAPCPFDEPKTLRFYKQTNQELFLYEDAISSVSDNLGINFLGQANIKQFPEDLKAADGLYKYNYNLFVDTAYINRGTGWIKPQYLIAVGVEQVEGKEITYIDACNDPNTKPLKPYIRGRYLINATDSARQLASDGYNAYPVRDKRYIIYTSWDRLAFVDAIHTDDRLYIVSELEKRGISESAYTVVDTNGELYVDADSLKALTVGMARTPHDSYVYGAYYDFEEWQNYHNDVTFSLRFRYPNAVNASEVTGEGGSDNDSKAFLLESETTKRDPYGNNKIAPVQGGWVKMENGVPVITRGSYKDAIGQAEVFNVQLPTGDPTSNDLVSSNSSVKVISGTDEISVLNANGKQVMVTNLLGQTIVNMVPNSDNVTVKAPKGIVIVTIEGEKAVKSIVK